MIISGPKVVPQYESQNGDIPEPDGYQEVSTAESEMITYLSNIDQ